MERLRRRSRPEEPTEAPGVPPQALAAAAAGGSVDVIWGSLSESLELAEMTVGEVFRMLQAPFNIAPAVAALVNGDPVDAEHRLRPGDELEFTRPAGEKGGGA
jgi:sulfur carrier protein ThiS